MSHGRIDGHKPGLLGAFTGQSCNGGGPMIPRLRVAPRVPKPGDLSFCRALLASRRDEGTMLASIIILRVEVREGAGVNGVPHAWASRPLHFIGQLQARQARGRVRRHCQSRVQGCSFVAALLVTPAHQQAYPNRPRIEPVHPPQGLLNTDSVDWPRIGDGYPCFSRA